MNAVIVRDGSRCRSRSENVTPSGRRRPLPNTLSRQVAGSMIGVAVWLRTKNRSFGIRCPSSPAASQRISAFVPNGMNHSAGRCLTIGPAAIARGGDAKRPSPATAGRPAAASCSSRRRDRLEEEGACERSPGVTPVQTTLS